MKKVDLVFRSVGERTSAAALDLAIQHIQPKQVHVLENVKPFAAAVQQMLQIKYGCDFVVFMDADCLILEDMTPFLQKNSEPYVDCYVLDKFRGQIHCGVHIARIDVVQAMQEVEEPINDPKYVLRPESRIRDLALKKLQFQKQFKSIHICHDFLQFYQDIFNKYVLRELRSRTDYHQAKLKGYQELWKKQEKDIDFQIANYAVEYARKKLPLTASTQEYSQFIQELPQLSIQELNQQGISEKAPLVLQEIEELSTQTKLHRRLNQTQKIFGIGLSLTGNELLTLALRMLGFNVAYSLDDEITLHDLMIGRYNFPLLNDFDGVTDITVAAFYAQLDKLFPNSKFILTVRNKESWLRTMEELWGNFTFEGLPSNENTMVLRRMLRVAVYGTYSFTKERFSYIYDLHYKNAMDYFKERPESLLILNIYEGEGWEKLCPFLKLPILELPFPDSN